MDATRRRFLQTASLAPLAGIALPAFAQAQTPISLRFSSSMVVDYNAAHFVWYQQLENNL